MKQVLVLLVVLVGLAHSRNLEYGDVGENRQGRLLVTTESIIVTNSGILYCYTTEKKLLAKTTECARKKKAIEINGIKGLVDDAQLALLIRPTKMTAYKQPLLEGTNQENHRKERFLYVVTKTETENTMIYTATTAITFKCTPAVEVMPECDDMDDDKKGDLKGKFDKLLGIGR
jgi:hypothetical protein